METKERSAQHHASGIIFYFFNSGEHLAHKRAVKRGGKHTHTHTEECIAFFFLLLLSEFPRLLYM